MLSTKQAAEILGVNASRIRQLILAGKLTATRIGDRVLVIDRRDLDAYMQTPQGKMGRPRKHTQTH